MNLNLINLIPKDKEKRNKLITTLIIIGVLLGLFIYFVIRAQYASIAAVVDKTNAQQAKLDTIKKAVKMSNATEAELSQLTAQLQQAEKDMASDDVYAWSYNFIRHFKAGYNVTIPTVDQPAVGDVDLLPKFPYQQVRISLNGSAYFHDFGKFVSDLENQFPHIRVVNLTLESSSNPTLDGEKLNFRADIIALVKPHS